MSTFIQWVIKSRTGLNFICMGSDSTDDCSVLSNAFVEVCGELGVPIADDKTVRPTTILTFLGFLIDTQLMMVIIPQDKLSKLQSSLRSMLSLTGLLSFCSKAIPSSRAFFRRLYDLISVAKDRKPHNFVKINKEEKADVSMLLEFLAIVFIQKKCSCQMKSCNYLQTAQVTQVLAVGLIFKGIGLSLLGLLYGRTYPY